MLILDKLVCEKRNSFIGVKKKTNMSMWDTSVVRRITAFCLIIGAIFGISVTASDSAFAVTGVNEQINFQGRLFNAQGAVVPDGNYNIQFKIYQDGNGLTANNASGTPAGSLKWTESWLNTNGNGVLVKNGYMSVELGSVNPFGNQVDWNQSVLWISMNIGSTSTSCTPFSSCTPDGEMLPMKRLSSTPYSNNSGKLNGLTSTQFLQLAQGVQTDASLNTPSIYVNKTGSGNLINLQSSGSDVFNLTNSGDVQFGAGNNHTLSIATSTTGLSGKSLTISAGTGGSGTGAAGGNLVLQGGNGGGTNGNGGNITISGGTATGTGVNGLVKIGASAYESVTNSACTTACTISQSSVDNYGTVIISALTPDIRITLPAPTTSAQGRILYLTTTGASSDFTLQTNTGGDLVEVAMRRNTTATMIWNGSSWTPGGASNATTLQATYANGTNPTTTPEIKLDSIRGTIDIQDADVSLGTDLLNIRGSNASGLGTVLFGVSNTGRVTIQGTTDQSSAFRVLDANGDYLLNVNSANGYIINNSTKPAGNELSNPGFESGGQVTSGEEGWFGPPQSTIVNTNTNNGNYAMQVTASAPAEVYAGTFYEVRAGDTMYFHGYVKNTAGTNGTAGVRISWYNKDKTLLSSTADVVLPGTSYVVRKVSATAPANAQYAKVSASVVGASTGTYYFDDFYLSKNVQAADYTFRNTLDSTAAFRIQSAGSAQTLFTADTSSNLIKIGDNTGTDAATTILVLDGASTNPTSLANKNGGLFYNTSTNSLKAIVGGAVVDVCTTAVTCSGYTGSAGSTVQLQGTTPGTAQTGNFNITGTGILTQLQTMDLGSTTQNLNIRSGNSTGGNSGSIVIDTGSATGTRGSITLGTGNVAVTMGGSLNIQGSNALSLGSASSASGSILFRNSAGGNTITLQAPGSNPSASYTLVLPQNLGNAGDCLKDSGSGALSFGNCATGVTTNLQDVYNNSSTPATITLADGKSLVVNAQNTTTDPSVLFNLQCSGTCGTGGRFAVQNAGVDVLSVSPGGGGVTLNTKTQIGSSTTDSTQTNFQLDSFNGANDTGSCDNSTNQGSLYYNSSTGTIRACVASGWTDVSNPEQLGLLSFGVVPQSGSQPYDLPSLQTPGASGPCKPYWSNATTVAWTACTAYSGGLRVAVNAGSLPLGTTAVNQWRHLCLTATGGQPAWTTASTTPTANMPTFSITAPTLCIADVKSSTSTAANIGLIYDTRTFTSSIKEAVTLSAASEIGEMVDAGTNGALTTAVSGSAKLYGTVVATNGGTSTTTPNGIVTTVGPAWIKAIAGTAGQFTKSSLTQGYVDTIASIPNNSFYYSAGNTRTSFSSTCTAANNCAGSLYVNLIVR